MRDHAFGRIDGVFCYIDRASNVLDWAFGVLDRASNVLDWVFGLNDKVLGVKTGFGGAYAGFWRNGDGRRGEVAGATGSRLLLCAT